MTGIFASYAAQQAAINLARAVDPFSDAEEAEWAEVKETK